MLGFALGFKWKLDLFLCSCTNVERPIAVMIRPTPVWRGVRSKYLGQLGLLADLVSPQTETLFILLSYVAVRREDTMSVINLPQLSRLYKKIFAVMGKRNNDWRTPMLDYSFKSETAQIRTWWWNVMEEWLTLNKGGKKLLHQAYSVLQPLV